MMQMYLRQSYFIWLQITLFWAAQCLVEYGFAFLPWDTCEGNSHPSLAVTIFQCGCQIFPLPSCSEHFSFRIRAKKTAKGSVSAAHAKWQNSNSIKRQGRPGTPGLGSESMPCLPGTWQTKKKKSERKSFCCNLQACQKWKGRRNGKGIFLRNRKSLKAAAAVTPNSLRLSVFFHLSLFGLLVPGKNWYVLALIHIWSAFKASLQLKKKKISWNASVELYPAFHHFHEKRFSRGFPDLPRGGGSWKIMRHLFLELDFLWKK